MDGKQNIARKGQKQDNAAKEKQKVYVLDTNVLLHDPNALFSFKGAHIVIPIVVLEELDRFKGEGTDRGRNSRQVIRYLDKLREKGSLGAGVELDNGGTIQILLYSDQALPEASLALNIADNDIILSTLYLKYKGFDVYFISKDLNARVKADALGIKTEDYIKEFISQSEFYRGWRRIAVPAVELKKRVPDVLNDLASTIAVNEYVLLESERNQHNYVVFRHLSKNNYKLVHEPKISWPLKSRNPQQLMALDLLFDKDIQFVCLSGPAGTGKTFLALLAGLYQVLNDREFERMLISRPVIPLGRDIGFLPGTVEEKLHSWMLPIYDNMEYIIRSVNSSQHFNELQDGQRSFDYKKDEQRHSKKFDKKSKKKHYKDKPKNRAIMSIDELVRREKVGMEAITYMRGRSIPYQFILIDEAQNLTPHEVKTLVTRVGEGSKIILAGDPYQIDSPYLDFASNGLIISSERFKGENIFGAVHLETSERSELSQLASNLL